MHISHTLLSRCWSAGVNCLNNDFHCSLCARQGQPEIDLCKACERWLKTLHWQTVQGPLTTLCLGCGEQMTLDEIYEHESADAQGYCAPREYCEECLLLGEPLFTRIVAPYRYAFPLDNLIKRVKYAEDRQFARVLGTLLGRAVKQRSPTTLPEKLLPMPLHASKWLERGFNQAEDVAVWCGRHLAIEVVPAMASRIVDTGSLAGLSRAERNSRILGAFRANDDVWGKHIAIVDDVMTTGASARELSRELYDSGAASVELWVLARTSSTRKASTL